MSRRRQRRRERLQRHSTPAPRGPAERRPIIREAGRVERLAYTRSQAAEALGISRSTLNRLLPFLETVELPWGTKLIPVDELERLLEERRRSAAGRREPATRGRPRSLPPELVERIRAERAAGKSLARIAAELNASGTPTAHGGRQWWPSTVRAVLRRRG
jgi:Recombinase/Bacterial regulatory protein, Fis family